MERLALVVRFAFVLLCACSFIASYARAQEHSESFDKAIRETVVDLGVSPYSAPGFRQFRGQLRCHYFQKFTVKELDLGQKGDEWVSITPTDTAHLTPCIQKHAEGEAVIQGEPWIAGYFVGMKMNLVFLEAPDCFSSGCPFGVFEASTRKKIFEDQRRLGPKGKFAEIRFIRVGGDFAMRYPRVVSAKCSVPQKKSECWNEILRSTGLTPQPVPKCTGYSGFNRSTGSGTEDQSDPSVVSFPVEVTIPGFNARTLPGAVTCWAAD